MCMLSFKQKAEYNQSAKMCRNFVSLVIRFPTRISLCNLSVWKQDMIWETLITHDKELLACLMCHANVNKCCCIKQKCMAGRWKTSPPEQQHKHKGCV